MKKIAAAALLALTLGSVGMADSADAAPYHHRVCTVRTHRVHVGHRWVVRHTRVCR